MRGILKFVDFQINIYFEPDVFKIEFFYTIFDINRNTLYLQVLALYFSWKGPFAKYFKETGVALIYFP